MTQSITANPLGQAPVGKLLIKFSIPCILSLLVSALYNMVDQIFIGNSSLGYLGNAATGVVFPILIISMAFAWCLGDGAAAYLSLCQGRGDTEQAHRCVGGAITVTFVISVVMALLCFLFEEPLLHLFGASDQTYTMARDYMRILLPAFPAFFLTNMTNGVIRSDRSPGFSMVAVSTGAVINLILDPIFIFALDWGIQGAAYATVIGQVASFLLSALYFTKSKSFRLTKGSFLPKASILGLTATLGISTFITQLSIVVLAVVCNRMLFHYGQLSVYGPDIPISVISIETKVFTIVLNIVVGIILGAQPIVGYNYGAGRYDRVRQAFRLSLRASILVSVLATILFVGFPEAVVAIFGSGSPLYIEFATMTFRIFLSLISFTCIIKMSSIFLQSVGRPVEATVISLVRDLICFVPLAIILPHFFGIRGILYAAPIADLLSIMVTVWLLRRFFHNLGPSPSLAPKES